MNGKVAALAASVMLVLGAICDAGAAVLYNPAPIGTSARVTHYSAVSGSGFRAFDNFTISSAALIEKVSWSGFWIDFGEPQPADAPSPNVAFWSIALYADNGGIPGAELYSAPFAAADVTSEFLGVGSFSVIDVYNASFYDYSIDLALPFAADAGTQYWISILSRADAYAPTFVLSGATGGDDSSYQQELGAGLTVSAAAVVARDRAIVLEGRLQVPEPGTLHLAGTALVLIAALGMRRRRRH